MGQSRRPATDRRLQEAFAPPIEEMTVGNMTRLLGIKPEEAQAIRSEFGNSDAIPRIYANWRSVRTTLDASENTWDVFHDQYRGELRRIVDFTRRFPKMDGTIGMAVDPNQALRGIAHSLYLRGEARPKADPIITFPDGWAWYPLSGDECSLEGDLMQHCGDAVGQMYSLRDERGLPHVTADARQWDDLTDRDDGPAPKMEVVQLRGKQNAAPDKKYWPHIQAFLDKIDAFVSDREAEPLLHLSPWRVNDDGYSWRRVDSHVSKPPDAHRPKLDDVYGFDVHEGLREAPAKDKALTAQRNVPREVVNVMTSEPAMRQMVWELGVSPKGTQAARLLRYMEDKGWRTVTVDGRRLMYHGRSFKLLEPVRPLPEWTLHAVYSLLRPLQADDTEHIDRALLKMWGYDQGRTTDMISLSASPSRRFISFVDSGEARERAAYVSDQLHQHTGIVLEPLAGRVPAGQPVDRGSLPVTRLPTGVDPEDLVVVAEGGSFYAVLARDFSPSVVHDSRAVISKGRVRVGDRRGPERPDDNEAGGDGLGAAWAGLQKRYGVTHGPSRTSPEEGDRGPAHTSDIHVVGDGGLTGIYQRARSLGRGHVYLVAAPARRIDPSPAALEYSRTGIYGEDVRVARSVRQTGGLPLRPGRWAVDDLGKFLRMFRRDYGTAL